MSELVADSQKCMPVGAAHDVLALGVGWEIGVFDESSGARAVSAGLDGDVKVWRLSDGVMVSSFTAHPGGVKAVAISPDGKRIASGGMDGTVKLWPLRGAQKAPLAVFKEHEDSVEAVAFAPDGKTLASGSKDKTVKLWKLP